MDRPIPPEVFEYFAAHPDGPLWNVSRALNDTPQPVVRGLNSFFDTISKDDVQEVQQDALFKHLSDGSVDADRSARIWITEHFLSMEIGRRKLALLCTEIQKSRPAPYGLPAIADVPVDSDHLVPLSAFKYDGSRLLRNGYAFNILTTTNAANSSYWLLQTLFSQGLGSRASVRLDPFLFGPEDHFPAMFYKMWMYGRPLDWERIRTLRVPEHGRWFPGSLSHKSEFTDFCWYPRRDRVHFVGEEVPKNESCTSEPSRYLHAIYNPASEQIQHFDGALRIYTAEELGERHRLHVRNGGKVGVREKVFRTDEPIQRDAFSVITQAFFVWNRDIQRYFFGELASPGQLDSINRTPSTPIQ